MSGMLDASADLIIILSIHNPFQSFAITIPSDQRPLYSPLQIALCVCERGRVYTYLHVCVCVYIFTYIYINIEREREREKKDII